MFRIHIFNVFMTNIKEFFEVIDSLVCMNFMNENNTILTIIAII